MCAYLRGKAAGKQNFGYVKCTTKKDKQKSVHKVKFLMNTRYGTDVHNDTLANPHEIKVFGSRRIYFTEKI